MATTERVKGRSARDVADDIYRVEKAVWERRIKALEAKHGQLVQYLSPRHGLWSDGHVVVTPPEPRYIWPDD